MKKQGNNNNDNNNNNNVIIMIKMIIIIKIYFPHPFLQWLFVLQKKKTIKTNKNVKIYQYVTVNTKNMTTKIVKGLRQQNESEGEIITKQKLNLA